MLTLKNDVRLTLYFYYFPRFHGLGGNEIKFPTNLLAYVQNQETQLQDPFKILSLFFKRAKLFILTPRDEFLKIQSI